MQITDLRLPPRHVRRINAKRRRAEWLRRNGPTLYRAAVLTLVVICVTIVAGGVSWPR